MADLFQKTPLQFVNGATVAVAPPPPMEIPALADVSDIVLRGVEAMTNAFSGAITSAGQSIGSGIKNFADNRQKKIDDERNFEQQTALENLRYSHKTDPAADPLASLKEEHLRAQIGRTNALKDLAIKKGIAPVEGEEEVEADYVYPPGYTPPGEDGDFSRPVGETDEENALAEELAPLPEEPIMDAFSSINLPPPGETPPDLLTTAPGILPDSIEGPMPVADEVPAVASTGADVATPAEQQDPRFWAKDYEGAYVNAKPTVIPGVWEVHRSDGKRQLVNTASLMPVGDTSNTPPPGMQTKSVSRDTKSGKENVTFEPATTSEMSKEQLRLLGSLRDDYRADEQIKDAKGAIREYGNVVAGLKQQGGLGDIATINALQRMIDPGVAVREGDITLMQQAIPRLQRLGLKASNWVVGDQLTAEARKQVEQIARDLYKGRVSNVNETVIPRYRETAKKMGIDFTLVGEDFPENPKGLGSEVGSDVQKKLDDIKGRALKLPEGSPERTKLFEEYRALRSGV